MVAKKETQGAAKRGMVSAAEAAKILTEKLAKEKTNGTSYKPETFMVLTRWTDKTRVKYGPNPKRPGSKSYPRYEKYSKAKTVGEAISLGAYPADLLWDFERGFYKVVGGPVREEPIDIYRAKAEGTPLTQTDEMLGRWVMRELCRELGTDQATLSKEASPSESGVVRALRLLADREAANVLTRTQGKIANADLLQCLRRWCFGKNPNRVNVMPDGKSYVNSDTVGLNCDRIGSVHATHATLQYPNVMKLMTRWMRERQPAEFGETQFPFTSVNMNFGYGAKRHRDGNNIGLSMLAGFGEYQGGELYHWPDDDKSLTCEAMPAKGRFQIDISKDLLLFDGHRCHEVAPFTGERYSLVWFTMTRYWKAGEATLKKLSDLGFVIPEEGSIKACEKLLRPPAGYGKAANASQLPGYMTWPAESEGPAASAATPKKRAAAKVAAKKDTASPAKPAESEGPAASEAASKKRAAAKVAAKKDTASPVKSEGPASKKRAAAKVAAKKDTASPAKRRRVGASEAALVAAGA